MKFATQRISPIIAPVLVVLGVVLWGCGSDAGSSSDNSSIPMNNGMEADVGTSPVDVSAHDASSDTAGDASVSRHYDPTLAELGDPGGNCPTAVVNADANEGPLRARIFVPNYRIDFDVLSSHQSFREHIHELVHKEVLPCRASEGETVVLFPESMGLPMLLIGDKAARARQMGESNAALTAMISEVEDAFLYYGEKFPDTSITNRFLLAVTDSVVRATYDTFGRIADRYDIFVSVTVDLPAFEKTTAPDIVARLGDPDYDTHDYVYEATDPRVYNRQILFGPDGKVVDETLKSYVDAAERDQLDLAVASFSDVHLMKTPWGKTGVAISKSAWMPDIQDRLDDLGAEVIFEPAAFAGGWVTPLAHEIPQDQRRWEPDVFMLGGWNMVQRAPRATHGFVPQLTGNFFELPTDGQIQIIEKASRQSGTDAFVGQRGSLSGNTFIGPWVIEDPLSMDASLTLAARRAELRSVGAKLLPGSGDPLENQYIAGMWAADLRGQPASPQVQTHPQIAVVNGAAYVVSSAGVPGERRLKVERYERGNLVGAYEQAVAGYDVVRPALAISAGDLHVVAELIGTDENRLAYTAFDPAQRTFRQDAAVLDENLVGRWAFHPSIAIKNRVLHLSWIKRVGDANRAFYAQTSLETPFASTTVNTELESSPRERPTNRANQWDARVAVDSHTIAVTWIDFKHWQWEVLASVSTDGGLNWSAPTRLDAVPQGVEALNSTPTIAALGSRRFLVAWTDARATRASTRVASRTFTVGSNGTVIPDEAHLIGASYAYDKWMWRPEIIVEDGGASVVYEVLDADKWAIERVDLDATGTPGVPETIVAPSTTAKHFPAAHATAAGAVVAFEEVIPHKGTASNVVVETSSP